jgi:hypothetical protein
MMRLRNTDFKDILVDLLSQLSYDTVPSSAVKPIAMLNNPFALFFALLVYFIYSPILPIIMRTDLAQFKLGPLSVSTLLPHF